MAVNQKAIKVLNKIFEAGFTDEKEISAMTMDDILSMQGTLIYLLKNLGCGACMMPNTILIRGRKFVAKM